MAPVVIYNDEWTWEYIYDCLYEKKAFDNIVISPGPGSPMRADDIGQFEFHFTTVCLICNNGSMHQ